MKTLYIWPMIVDEKTAFEIAERLLQIKAIKLQPDEPFTWASGWKSPIYCDNRIILSHPPVRYFVKSRLSALIRDKFPEANLIAGVATGAIAMGVLVAQELDLPFVYVRPEPKSHGRKNQIEGQVPEGAKTVVIEDLVSTGGSSLKAVDALREAEVQVLGMMAVFTYGFPVASENFRNADCQLFTLSDYEHLLTQAQQSGSINASTFSTLQEWRRDPASWFVKA